jgi:DNA polymerase-1
LAIPQTTFQGVQKVGPKTAVNWLTKYETVENIITNAEEITGKVGEYLRDGIEQLKLSQQLTTIKKMLNWILVSMI